MTFLSIENPWFWWPTIGSTAVAVIYGYAAYFYGKAASYPRTVRASGFNGIVRETAKFTLLGSGAGFIASILADELKPYPFFRSAMFAVLLISLIAAILNYVMSAALDTRTTDDGKSVELTTPLWAIVHGIIFGLSLGAMVSLLVAIAAFAVRFS